MPSGFMNIDRRDVLVVEIEQLLHENRQFFYVADLLRLQIRFITEGSKEIIGVIPELFDLATLISKVHPDDKNRYSISRAQYIKMGQELFLKECGEAIISTHFRLSNNEGNYSNLLFQGYMFYCAVPVRTVYTILLLTDLSGFGLSKRGYHYYVGNDILLFRYPDTTLLNTGRVFSYRELEILKMIAQGLDSREIAKKLFLSVNTVNTHRKNILRKTKKTSTHDLIIELQDIGMI
jgi:DNA-binding CsgD family transcriptional regulator